VAAHRTLPQGLSKGNYLTPTLICGGNYLRVGFGSEGNSASTAKVVAASDINMRSQGVPFVAAQVINEPHYAVTLGA